MKKPLLKLCGAVDAIVELCWKTAAVLLGFIILILAVQIFRRSLFNAPIFGIEEAVTASIVWFAALGSIVVTKQNGHAQVEYFLRFFPEKVRKVIHAASYVIGIIVSWCMIDGGIRMYKIQRKAVPQGGLPFGKVYYYALPMIVLGILLVLVCFSEIIKIFAADEKEREGGDII